MLEVDRTPQLYSAPISCHIQRGKDQKFLFRGQAEIERELGRWDLWPGGDSQHIPLLYSQRLSSHHWPTTSLQVESWVESIAGGQGDPGIGGSTRRARRFIWGVDPGPFPREQEGLQDPVDLSWKHLQQCDYQWSPSWHVTPFECWVNAEWILS